MVPLSEKSQADGVPITAREPGMAVPPLQNDADCSTSRPVLDCGDAWIF
jgi:hypothetical protein